MRIAMIGAAVCLSVANVSFAQTTDESTPQLEEIVVTAQKTTEVASKTPIALSVFSGESLKEQGVVNVADLQNVAPALNVGQSPAGVNITLRGVSTTDVTSKGDQGVVFSVDGIPVGRPREMALGFFDLERVEVLRGPQGTLYGKSSTGGVISVITAKPKDVFDAAASFELGNFNTRRGEAMVNMPVSDNFAVRAAASFNARDGYLNPTINNTQSVGSGPARSDQNDQSGRLSALWNITDGANLLLTGTFGHIGGVGSNYNALYTNVLNKSGSAARAIYFNPMGGQVDDRFAGYNAELNIDMGAARLTYDGARKTYNAHDQDSTSSNDPAGNGNNYSWRNYVAEATTDSHELRFANAQPQSLEWVAGYNFYKEVIDENDQNWQTAVATPTVAATTGPNPVIVGVTSHKSWGLFGQINWHVTDDFKVTVGARHSSDDNSRRGVIWAGPVTCQAPIGCFGTGATPDNGDQSASKNTWRLGADYLLSATQMLYASVSTGYKAGGFNDYDPVAKGTAAYDPEELTAYEVGYKGQLLPNLQFNSSAYYYDYSKMQVSGANSFNAPFTPPVIFIYTKAAPVTIYGWENELHWKATDADLVDVSLALAKGKYDKLMTGFVASQQFNWDGKELSNLPKVSGTLSYAHRFYEGKGGYYEARLSTRYNSGYYQNDLAGSANPFLGIYQTYPTQYKQDSFTRSDVSFGYTSESGKVDLTAFVRNIEDKLQLTSAPQSVDPANPNSASVGVTAPRTFGVRVGLKY